MTHSVLVIDDQADWRMLFRIALKRYADASFEVVGEAGTPQAGIDLAASLTPDVIVLDLSMPGRDGLETIAPLVEASPDSRIIVVSAWPEREAGAPARELGAAGYVEKSRPIGQIVEELNRQLVS